MTVSVWTPYASANLNGTAIDTGILKGARVESSFADPVSKGYVKCTDDPGAAQGDDISITLGGGSNNILRFQNGTVLQSDILNTGPNWEIVCRGPLYAAQKYRNNRPNGITLLDLTGGPASDQDIAKAVLDIAGVPYSGGNIGGTGITRGALAAVGYTWRKGESALEYLSRLSKSSLGYKVVESIGATFGTVYRTQILGTPGSSDFTLTEGEDIFEGGHTQVSTFDTYNAWEVTGFDYGDGNGAVRFAYPDPIPDGSSPYAFSSEMIERALDADPGGGISAETVLGFIRGSSDGPITKISGLQTPRDDLMGPGAVCHVNAPNTLGVNGNFWVVGVVAECDENWFTQTLELAA